jgi:multicomponent K+:H+ antiporter subunit G
MTGAVLLEALISLLILAGAFFTLAGSIALVRFPDFFLRLHGPTKATTLGVGSLLIASALFFSWQEEQIRFPEVLIMLFLFMTAPVSAHLLAKAALHLGVTSGAALPRKRPHSAGWSSGEGGPELAIPDADHAARHSRSHASARALS